MYILDVKAKRKTLTTSNAIFEHFSHSHTEHAMSRHEEAQKRREVFFWKK